MPRQALVWIIVCVWAAVSPASAMIIDGNLSDWGVTVADNNHSTYVFAPGIGLVGSHIEDQKDTAGHSAYLGPNVGGQDYDAELMAVAYDGGKIYVAIVTGQRPDNGMKYYAPGDLRIVANGVTLGLEIGGGAGGGSGSAISAGASGSTYTLKSSGKTLSHASAAPAQEAGSIWRDVTWLNDPIAPPGPTQFEINGSSTQVGTAEYVFTRNSVTHQHSIIELSFDASILGAPGPASFHWRPACGNDELDVTTTVNVPEPATVALLAIGLAMFRRRRA